MKREFRKVLNLSYALIYCTVVLTGCGKVNISTTLEQKAVLPSKVLSLENKQNQKPEIESLTENPESFIEFLSDKLRVQQYLSSLTEADIESLVFFDEDGDVIESITPTLKEFKTSALQQELLSNYMNYNTEYSLNLDKIELAKQEVLWNSDKTVVLQEYTNGQLVLISFSDNNIITGIDVFTLRKDTSLINETDAEHLPLDLRDDEVQLLYNCLTSNRFDYNSNLCRLNIKPELLKDLSNKYQRFLITDCFKNENTVIFIDSFSGKDKLILCKYNESLSEVQVYE